MRISSLTQLLATGVVALTLAGAPSPADAFKCKYMADEAHWAWTYGSTVYRDTTLYKRWRENQGMSEFTGDFTDAQDEDAHPYARRFWIGNGNVANRIDSVKFWLKDADGNLLAEVNRGINIPLKDIAKFQIPWKDGYQLNMRVTWVKYGGKKTWEDVWDGDDGDGYMAAGGIDGKTALWDCS